MYGHVHSSKDCIMIEKGKSDITIKLEEPCSYLKIYNNTFKFNLYINDDLDPIYVGETYLNFTNGFMLDVMTIHNFRVEISDTNYTTDTEKYPFKFLYVALS